MASKGAIWPTLGNPALNEFKEIIFIPAVVFLLEFL